MRLILASIAILFSTVAFAQAPQQQPSPSEQAMASKLMEEINANITFRAQIVTLQKRIQELEAQPKPTEPPSPPKEKK